MTATLCGVALLLLVATCPGYAAQFRVSTGVLSVPRTGPAAASWGDVSIFAGGAPGAGSSDVVDIFVNGVYANTTNMYDKYGTPVAASSSPGVITIAVGRGLQFFDANAMALWPRNATDQLSIYPKSAIGAETASLAAFVTTGSGEINLVNTAQRAVLATTLNTGRGGVRTARVRDSAGVEYFVFVGGATNAKVSFDASVLQVTAPAAFVTPTSKMAVARTYATCATTSLNKIVCLGGQGDGAVKLSDGEACTISTAGVLQCVALTVPTAVAPETYPIVSLGPFVATRIYGSDFKYGVAVSDAAFTASVTSATFDWPYWNIFGATSNGRFAYFAGGMTGVGVVTGDVTIIECLAPCTAPLISATPAATSAAPSTTASIRRTAETGAGSALDLPLFLVAGLCAAQYF